MATAAPRTAAHHIAEARAAAALYLRGNLGNEAERARMQYQIGCLRDALVTMQTEWLAATSAPAAPVRQDMATVTVDGVEIEAHFTYSAGCRATKWEPGEPEEVEIRNLFIGGQNVNALLDGEHDDAIEEALLAPVRAQGVVAAMDRAQELAEDAS
jgi:hypothetical protein